MKNFLKFIIFLTYVTLIFFVKNKLTILIFIAINITLMIAIQIDIKKLINKIKAFMLIVILTTIVNMLIIDVQFGINIGIKLLLVCHVTCIFSQKITYMELAENIEKLFYPIKWIGLNPKDVSLLVCIALSFIPILKDEIYQIKNSLQSKGFELHLKNIQLIFKPFFISIINRVNDIENALKSKSYQE